MEANARAGVLECFVLARCSHACRYARPADILRVRACTAPQAQRACTSRETQVLARSKKPDPARIQLRHFVMCKLCRPPAHARTPAACQLPQPRREGLDAGAPLERALAEWACELPLGMQLVAAAHGAAGLATPSGLRLAAAEPRAAAAMHGMRPRDGVVVRACRPTQPPGQPQAALHCRLCVTSPSVAGPTALR